MDVAAEDLLEALASSGWRVRRSSAPGALLPPPLNQRYPNIPPDAIEFLGSLDECVSPSEQIWMFTRHEYEHQEEPAFRWNECELMSLEAAEADNDGEWQSRIREFWDSHFPFMMAVHSDYDYLAIDLTPSGYGRVVHGFAPEFEDAGPVAASFNEFLVTYAEAIRKGESEFLFPFVREGPA
jgi:hypothetical protein